ncbi:MAG: dynamin family protein, partial [Rubrivivax sp.]
LSLLAVETRLRGLSLAELRGRDEHWHNVPLDARDPRTLVQALAAVTRTQQVDKQRAIDLGFWSDERPEDNPPVDARGFVEVPTWRHAVINYPHPLLKRGLVVIDTPGLNAIGAEPELTLGLLPSAHAVVFVLGADTGVTKSDLAIWRDHLGQASLERFVVLNKIDTLADPLVGEAVVQAQIEQQRQETARTLEVPAERVFPLSAREALAARVDPDERRLAASRLPPLEAALATGLLPRRQELLVQSAVGVVEQLRQQAGRRLGDRRRTLAEQLMELRGLRGKSGAKTRLMLERVEAETADFERCTAKLSALRSVQARILKSLLAQLSADSLRREVGAMHAAMTASLFNLGGKAAFETLMTRVRGHLAKARQQADEMREMLEASFRQLNTEFGFAFAVSPMPSMKAFIDELDRIDQNYGRYLGLGQAIRMATPGFAEQFRRMLLSKLRVVFENAAGEIELWSKSAQGQVEMQLRERRRGFTRRKESLQRVQLAAGELEQRIAEVQAQDDHLGAMLARLSTVADEAVASARRLGSVPSLPRLVLDDSAEQDAA